MPYQQSMQDLALLTLRTVVGGYLLLAGWGKVQLDLDKGMGTFYEIAFKDKGMQPSWLPDWFAMPYGYALPWLELLVGGLLILGLFTRITSLIGLGMITSFTIAWIVKVDDIKAQPDSAAGPFSGNYIQVACYLLFVLVGAGRLSFDRLMFGPPKGS